MDISAESLALHYKLKGKLEVISRYPIQTQKDLSLAYTPGVAAPCLEIQKDPAKSFQLTRRQNMVAVITDGSAVLGLGNIGPVAGMPVMEGKCVLFKEFAGVDAFPLCVDTQDVDEMVKTIALISKSFGGINLEDISAPRCFEVERRLKEVCDIPVFHDDQHGTAVVITAALTNALKVVGKKKEDVKIVFNGIGAAGGASAKLLLDQGFSNMLLCDKDGILCEGDAGLPPHHAALAARTNREHRHGTLADALVGADVFIGVSRPGLVTGEMVERMAKDPILLAMANLACIDIAIMRIRPADNSRTTRHSRGVLLFLPVLTGLAILIRPLVYQLSIVWLTSALGMLHLHFDRQNEKILTDPLTMIGNRRACEGYMLRHLSRPPREDRQMFVCLIDVDQFKAINDQYGHDMGDHALRQTADILLQLSQPGDFVGRIGGDEFVVAGERGLLWDTDYARLQVNQAVERFNREGGMPYRLGLTCGFSCARPGEEFSMDALLRQADLRMYSARGVTLQTVKAEENL